MCLLPCLLCNLNNLVGVCNSKFLCYKNPYQLSLSANVLETSTAKSQSFKVLKMARLIDLKSSVLLSSTEVQARQWMKYLKEHWKDLTIGLHNATILILAGRHGQESGAIGDAEFFQDEATGEQKNRLMYNHERLVSS